MLLPAAPVAAPLLLLVLLLLRVLSEGFPNVLNTKGLVSSFSSLLRFEQPGMTLHCVSHGFNAD